mgnify:CR=1 FL=1
MSDMSDPFGILELFKDPARLTKSVLSDPRSSIGPTCPTSGAEGCAEKVALNQSGPTCPTCPTQIPAEVASPALADVLDEAIDRFEERAALREYAGHEPREVAEAAALAETARLAGLSPSLLRRHWASHQDARAVLEHLRANGPVRSGSFGSALGWDFARAWQAQACLRAAGLLFIDTGGWACLERQGDLVSGRRRN